MNTPENRKPDGSELVVRAKERLETFLPATFGHSEKRGWVETYQDSGNVYVRPPRNKRKFLGIYLEEPESVELAERSAKIGRLPVDEYTLKSGLQPPRLRVTETVFSPNNPVHGSAKPIKSLSAIFYTHASVNPWYGDMRVDGLDFRFLERDDPEEPIEPVVHLARAITSAGGFPASYNAETDEFLETNGYPKWLDKIEKTNRVVELLNFCVDIAEE